MKSSFKCTTPKIKSIVNELRATRKYFKYVKNNDDSFRDRHMDDRATEFVRIHPHMKHGGVVTMIKNAEKQKKVSFKIDKTLNGYRAGALSYVLIPAREEYDESVRTEPNFDHTSIDYIWPRVNTKQNGRDIHNWEVIDKRHDVEALTLAVLKCHFAQANGSPLTTDDWITKLTSRNTQDQITDGTFDTSNLPKPMQIFFSELIRPDKIKRDLPFNYSFTAFCQCIKNADERTSASPSGRHYGHYKVLLDYLPGILEDIFRIMKICIKHGVILDRFTKTVTTLICKDGNRPLIHRLRPLHLIEIELQAISKSQWAKQLVSHAEKNNLIAESQYGGRANKQAQSLILNKTLVYDIQRHMAQDFSSVDEDLKACYDRELAHLGAVEDRYYGNSYEHGKFITETTKGQQFFVKTKFGISDKCYKYTDDNKVWGLGQGIGWSGSRWTLTSSTIDRCMEKTCNGLLLKSPDNTVVVKKMLAMFVDDLAQLCNQHPNKSVLQQTIHNVQTHADLVYVTGGSLALPKCKFYLVEFYFDEDGEAHVYRKQDRPTTLSIKDPVDDKMIDLQHYDPFQSHDNLGYWLNPMGTMTELFELVLNDITDWSNKVENSTLWPEEIVHSYIANLKPSFTYRLAGASFSFEACDLLMKIIYPILLRAHQLPITFPRVIASAPFTYAGIQIEHIYDVMGKEKLKFFMMHIKRGDTTGQLMYIALQFIQLTLGTEAPFYSLNYSKYKHFLKHSWITHLWEYIDSRGVEIELTKSCAFNIQRQSDQFIMDVLAPHFTPLQLKEINKIRLHLKVLRLSDVCDVTGKIILPNIKEGINHRISTYGWPNQPLVKKLIPLWKQACHRLQTAISNRPLGQWTNMSQRFQWHSNSTGSIISGPTGTYQRVTKRGKNKYHKTSDSQAVLPYDADVFFYRGSLRFMAARTDSIILIPQHTTVYNKFFESNDSPHSLEKKILKLMKKNRLLYGSDASVNDDGRGAFAWGIKDRDNPNHMLICSNAPIHGDIDQIHSTRGEMFGVLGCIRHIKHIMEKFKWKPKQKIPIYTDSSSTIQIAQNPFYLSFKNTFDDDVDIKTELRTHYKRNQNYVSLHHVKAHQDEKVPFHDLSLASKLNVAMDIHAKAALLQSTKIKHRRFIPHLPLQKVSLKTKFDRITNDIGSNVNRYKIGHESEKWIQKRWNITEDTMKLITWSDLKHVLKNSKFYKKTQYVKIIHKMWATNKRQFEWKQTDSPKCPFCKTEDESRMHIFTCSNVVSKSFRKLELAKIRKELKRIQTAPLLTNHILRALHQFHNSYPVSMIQLKEDFDPTEREHMNLINEQFKLGIDNLLSGALTTYLSSIQQHHISTYNVGRFTSIRSWNRSVLRLFLDHANAIWQYRCKILHDEDLLTREATLRNQAIALLNEYKTTPEKIAFEQRDLLNRKVSYLKTTHLRNVRSWLNRINIAIETEMNRVKNGRTDIRRWITKNVDSDMKMRVTTVEDNTSGNGTVDELIQNINPLTKTHAPN